MKKYSSLFTLDMYIITVIVAVLILSFTKAQHSPNCAAGRPGQVIVHLFEWRWTDIANECEKVLGPKGFCGVQVSPPNEHRIVYNPDRPWWERYQPVSYKLDSRSGSRSEFIDMVQRCNSAGVRIYIDAVINHMAGVDSGTGIGTGGSYYNTQAKQFDGVPYGPNDFGKNCPTSSGNIDNYGDAQQVRNCRLLGLLDLNGGSSYVRNKVAGYFNDMLEIGIDGYRIDAAKHMWPGDIQATLGMTQNSKYGDRPYVFMEVIDLYGSEPIKAGDYVHLGQVTEFKYGLKMAEIFKKGLTELTYLQTFGSSWGMLSNENALVFVDNHDNQRGHGGGGNIVTYKDSYAYKMAAVFMLSWPYGVPRVMSSYDFNEDWTGPPSNGPGTSSGACQNEWICEHRWTPITNMVAWRNSAGTSEVENWWSNGNNQIAFSRGNSAFIAFNRGDGYMDEWLNTGLPAGVYCDVISGDTVDGQCTGRTVTVHADGRANVVIDGNAEEPYQAIHVEAKSDNGDTVTNPATQAPPEGLQRTIVFMNKNTIAGQNVFMRGGCGSTCTLPISYYVRPGNHFSSYNAWSQGDTRLDWSGAEMSQSSFNGIQAEGSPMAWTSNNPSNAGYVGENSYGEHMWMWDVYMDCSSTNGGWFELKGIMNGQWENDVSQSSCQGSVGGASPIRTNNHIARCGYINKFVWSSSACTIDSFNKARMMNALEILLGRK